MLRKILIGSFIFILIVAVGGVVYYRTVVYVKPLISNEDRAVINVMPLPAKLKIKNGSLDLSSGIFIEFPQAESEYLNKASQRFIANLQKIKNVGQKTSGIPLKIICVGNSEIDIPQIFEDESYFIEIKNDIILSANTPLGINHGLETILQLITIDGNNISIPKLKIKDNPRFVWRGIMLDVSRHWMPKQVVLQTLEAMAAVKMNVFHWHLSDDQGFRVESKAFPKLHKLGSNGSYYTQDEIREVVAFAAERGIRVIPEFDVPGHSKSWQIAYPELGTLSEKKTFENELAELFSPPLDPSKEIVYEFLDTLIGEMAALFPDQYFHIGGDEVDPKYWEESKSIQRFKDEKGLKNAHDLQAYFNSRIYKLVKKHGKKMVGWEEILNERLESDVVTQSWRGQKSLFESVQLGHKSILSAGWYLDYKLHAEKHYAVDPLILPGAVEVEPDTTNWKMYDLVLQIPNGDLESKLILFDREKDNVFGFLELAGNRSGFKNGSIKENQLNFDLESPMGTFKFVAELLNDSISGKISLALLSFKANGKLVAGSHIAGTNLPKFEVIKPLTDEQKSMILGGEAAMWSEVVGENNVASRLWPRSAAIAEKLWSPIELTANVDDMYRRLESVSEYLAQRGSPHIIQQNTILKQLIEPGGFTYLKTLVSVLEEVKYYDRLALLGDFSSINLPDYPTNQVVDAARPESMTARKFNKMVDRYVANVDNSDMKEQLQKQLKTWSLNHDSLKPWLNSEELLKVAQLSEKFSLVSERILKKLKSGKNVNTQIRKETEDLLDFLETGENGMLCAVADALRKLYNQ